LVCTPPASLRSARAFRGVDVLEDARRVNREVRIRAVRAERVHRPFGGAAFGRVMDDLERSTDMLA
jgi:hypothetical protein